MRITPKTHKVTRDNKDLFQGDEDLCWIYILNHQSQSVDWAIKYEGWKIEEIKEKEGV